MSIWDAALLAGGSGTRFQADSSNANSLPKQFQTIGEYPVLVHALHGLLRLRSLRQIAVVCPREHLGRTQALFEQYFPYETETKLLAVPGGERRQDSAHLAIEALSLLSPPPTRILIHDGCRPYLSDGLLSRVKKALEDRSMGAWIPALAVTETLKRVSKHCVAETVDRSDLVRVQTPQVFEFTMMQSLAAKARATTENLFTDDASICEYYGIPVGVFEGDPRNIKLTYPHEVGILRPLLAQSKRIPPCDTESVTTFTE